MPRREKTIVAAKRRPNVVPMEASMEPRSLAKHPVQHRGDSVPRAGKRGRKRNGR
ncbi:MAG TPA: hypothetical protein VGQ73_00915 [Gemmatimonadales bacterium]|jgi:hypothetical protein|nr:hypothetical protein [Gemmatimonadales bacterium]